MGAAAPASFSLPIRRGRRGLLSRPASDEVLVGRVRNGDENAFALLYERHHRPMLAFCRHMLGSREEAEDAVQQTFASAYLDMGRDDKVLNVRPWLFQIARNHCISAIRRRRPEVELDDAQPALAGLSEEVAARGELRDLLADLARLPDEQREALVLAELHDNSHSEVADILGCEREKVKSLVFQARTALAGDREARELSCDDVRRKLSALRGSALRRGAVGRHLRGCDPCRAFRADVGRQRKQLGILLVVVPSVGLKTGASAAYAKAAGGAKAAGAGAGSSAGSSSGMSFAILGGKLAVPSVLVKGAVTVTAMAALAGGGAVAIERTSGTVEKAPITRSTEAVGDHVPTTGSAKVARRRGDPARVQTGAATEAGQDSPPASAAPSSPRRDVSERSPAPADPAGGDAGTPAAPGDSRPPTHDTSPQTPAAPQSSTPAVGAPAASPAPDSPAANDPAPESRPRPRLRLRDLLPDLPNP